MAKSKFNIKNLNYSKASSDIFGEPNVFSIKDLQQSNEKPSMIKREDLKESPKNPYNVDESSEEMTQLIASIKEQGILTPLLARPKGSGYEIISGHRRKKASDILGLEELPVFIKDLTDEEADRIMVDMNLNRENILPSEKAKAIKLKYDAIKKTRGRKKAGQEKDEHNSAKLIAEEMGMSDRAIQEYIRLTYLSKYVMDAVDSKKIPQKAGKQLSYLPKSIQDKIVTLFIANEIKLSDSIAKDIRDQYDQADTDGRSIETYAIKTYVSPKKAKKKRAEIILPGKIKKKFFPKEMSDEEIEGIILELLKGWAKESDNGPR